MERPPCLCTERTDIVCTDTHCDLAHPTGAPGDRNKCRVCWKRLLGKPAREPGLLRKVFTYGKAVARDVLAGRPRVTDEQKAARLDVCRDCPQFNPRKGSCRVCGCNLDAKAGMATEDCPEGRWPHQDAASVFPPCHRP